MCQLYYTTNQYRRNQYWFRERVGVWTSQYHNSTCDFIQQLTIWKDHSNWCSQTLVLNHGMLFTT